MKIEITKAQLEAIKDMTNDLSAMIGCGEHDKDWKNNIKMVDRMLSSNNLEPRDYK